MVVIGARAHDLGRGDARSIADAAARAGVSCLQLAPSKALTDCPPPPEPMSEAWAEAVGEALSSRGIGIAVLGCYVDICGPEAGRRAAAERLAHNLSMAPAFGAPAVATETPLSGGPSREALEYLRDALRDLVQIAERSGAALCVEPVWGHAVDTPRAMASLLDAIGSASLGVVLDPVNLADPGSGEDPALPALEAIELFGDRIVALHVKDFVVRGGAKVGAMPGTGFMDWARVARAAAAASPRAPFIVEDQDAAGLDAGRSLLLSIFGEGLRQDRVNRGVRETPAASGRPLS